MDTRAFSKSTDDQLHRDLPRLALRERFATADFVACLAEFESRRLHLELGFTSIYAYCAEKLHLTEGAAYRRIEAARTAHRFPAVLEMLRDERLSLATAALLGPRLTASNASQLLENASFKSKREVEVMIAKLNPQPPVPSVIRKLPEPKAIAPVVAAAPTAMASTAPAPPLALPGAPPPSRRPIVAPLSESHYKLQVTISASARERLCEIQGLMRHRLPGGDPAAIVEHALEVLHAQLLKEKAAQVAKPRTGRQATEAAGRHIPASVKREVWRRDEGNCAFIAAGGKRCGAIDSLEFHHVQPYAVGGAATATNIQLRCRAHNGFEWERHLEAETAALVGG
jgi:5-methylcytosine-specific restriction endonuclease McrA